MTGQPMSHDAISAQIRAGSDRGIPLEHRPAMTPSVQGVVVCSDQKLTERARATRVEPGRDLTDLRLPGNATVVGRNAPILVQRGEDAPVETLEMKIAVSRDDSSPAVYAERPAPSDGTDLGIGTAAISIPYGSRVGVIPAASQVRKDPVPVVPVSEVIAQTVETPAVIGVNHPTLPQAVSGIPKVTVNISGESIGRIRVKVASVTVSDHLIVLWYCDDDDMIVEPPVGDATIMVETGGVTYPCLYRGSTLAVPKSPYVVVPMFLVVLIRAVE